MRTSTIARSGSCSATSGEQRLGVADAPDDLVPASSSRPARPSRSSTRVLGDHDAHGNSAAIRVPAPGGLSMTSVPPCAATRSASPARPVPPCAAAPPTPSSATRRCRTPSRVRSVRSWTCVARGVLDRVRHRLAGDVVRGRLDLRRRAVRRRVQRRRARARPARGRPARRAGPRRAAAGAGPAAIVRRSVMRGDDLVDRRVQRGHERARLAAAASAAARRSTMPG